jgi:hypothetical protein
MRDMGDQVREMGWLRAGEKLFPDISQKINK